MSVAREPGSRALEQSCGSVFGELEQLSLYRSVVHNIVELWSAANMLMSRRPGSLLQKKRKAGQLITINIITALLIVGSTDFNFNGQKESRARSLESPVWLLSRFFSPVRILEKIADNSCNVCLVRFVAVLQTALDVNLLLN